ncbi:SDR family NAD(P)-dependent oxidoreductase [Mesorhizobium sp. CA13]|uniref:SDR family NAD(P)-dependent oxidoreductase n=1 Tax=Mesorhizobium sp. CA13 TaxID=2876643 RepID=UPI001CCAF91E|nr:SDR family NAD(P)-dependent oxidoreductase [Mesorhizobium sp. CA13]
MPDPSILVSSIPAFMSFPGYTTYSATKAAVRSFARTWTAALRDRGTDIAANVRNRTDRSSAKRATE